MTLRERLDLVLAELPEHRLCEVFDFARFLHTLEGQRKEAEEWAQFGLASLARAYAPEEPEYTEADLKPESRG